MTIKPTDRIAYAMTYRKVKSVDGRVVTLWDSKRVFQFTGGHLIAGPQHPLRYSVEILEQPMGECCDCL